MIDMKTKILFLFFIMGIIPFLAFSQKNNLALGGLYLPCGYGDRIAVINTSYFKNISPKSSVGIIVDLARYIEEIDEYYQNWYGEKDFASKISLIYKNKFYDKGRSSLYYGSGITAGTSIKYYKTIPKILVCGTGLPDNWTPPKPPNHWNYEYFSGITAMLDYQYRIIDDFYAGAGFKAFLLYYFESKDLDPQILPLLKIGYKW